MTSRNAATYGRIRCSVEDWPDVGRLPIGGRLGEFLVGDRRAPRNLFGFENVGWIDTGGSPRGQERGGAGRQHEDGGCGRKRRGVHGLKPVQERGRKASERRGADDAGH